MTTACGTGLANSYSALFGFGAVVLFVFVMTGAMELGAEVWRMLRR